LAGALGISMMGGVRRQGRVVLWAVLAYSVATILFGVSRSFPLCFLALAGTGAADTVSTGLRQPTPQLNTPHALRGGMTSVNMIFLMGGPQLGELEAGLVAGALGAAASVVSGGIAGIVTVAAMAAWAPWLRNYDGDEER